MVKTVENHKRRMLTSFNCGLCGRNFITDALRMDTCPFCFAERSLYVVGQSNTLPKQCIFVRYGNAERVLETTRRRETIEYYRGL